MLVNPNNIKKSILIIFIFGLVLRLAYVLFFPQIGVNRGDSERYDRIAQNIVTKQTYSYQDNQPDVFWSPGYPVFLAFIYQLLGINYLPVRIIQAILSSLLILLVYYLGSEFFGYKIGILSAIITAAYPGFIGYAGLFSPQLLTAFLVVLFFNLLVKYNLNIYSCLILGIIAGYSSLVRPELALFWFLFLVIMGLTNRKDKAVIKFSILIFLIMSLIISLWTIRNYKVFGRLIPISIHYGDVLWYSTWKGEWLEYKLQEPYSTIAQGLGPVDTAQAYFKASIRNVEEHPFIYLKMCSKRLYRLWVTGHSNIFYYMRYSLVDYLRQKSYFILCIKLFMLFFNSFIVLAGFLGIRAAFIKFKKAKINLYLLSYPVAFFVVLHFFIFATPRYSIPIMPFMIIFASYTFIDFLNLKQKNKIGLLNIIKQLLYGQKQGISRQERWV